MKVGIDASNLRVGGGITHLVEILQEAKPLQYGINQVIVWGGAETLEQLPTRRWLKLVHEPMLDKSLPFRLYWQTVVLEKKACRSCDLLFVPGGNYAGKFRPYVTMFRNLLPFDEAEISRAGFSAHALKMHVLRAGQSATFRKAEGVIFLSEHTRSVIANRVGKLPGKSTVIPHGLSDRFRMSPRRQEDVREYSTQRPIRILYVSRIEFYKHPWHVAEAVADLRKEGLPVALDIAGSAHPPALTRLFAALRKFDPKAEYLRYRGAIPFTELHRLYREADLSVFASTCETMPNILLENMGAGLPIVCSNRRPMPEILRGGGTYFNPESPAQLRDELRRMIHDPELRASCAAEAYRLAEKFSWRACAEETFSFLARVGKARKSRMHPAMAS
ncbi:MAG TPA: glycosyltransferase family 1 protein [Candidatus Angelobacter sp.]|nr:glycosyltransferase family 1 protein [Candidatus Angelobacter sp.]